MKRDLAAHSKNGGWNRLFGFNCFAENIKMGCFALFFCSVLAVLLVVSAQFDNSILLGKECSSAFHCWRTEPVDEFGQPMGLFAPQRGKRLEIGGGSRMKGGKCRCIEDRCQLFHIASSSYFACEEF